MSPQLVGILGEILAVQARIEGMKAENAACAVLNETPVHGKAEFEYNAATLQNLANQAYMTVGQ